jgi:hypothetical protein
LELWIPIAIGAAFWQNLHSALQKHLKARLSTTGASFSRFADAATRPRSQPVSSDQKEIGQHTCARDRH